MPGDTPRAVCGTKPDECELLGGCYSHGAIVVRAHLARFHALFVVACAQTVGGA